MPARARAHPTTGWQHHSQHPFSPADSSMGFIEHHSITEAMPPLPRRAGHCHDPPPPPSPPPPPPQHLRARATSSGGCQGAQCRTACARPARMASRIIISGLSAGGQHLFARLGRACSLAAVQHCCSSMPRGTTSAHVMVPLPSQHPCDALSAVRPRDLASGSVSGGHCGGPRLLRSKSPGRPPILKSHCANECPTGLAAASRSRRRALNAKTEIRPAAATLLRGRIAIRSGSTVWAQSLGQMMHGIHGCILASAKSRRRQTVPYLPSTLPAAALWSVCAAWRGAAPGGDQRSAARTEGPLRTAVLSRPKASGGCGRCWNRGSRPCFRALTRQPSGSCVVHACMHARESAAPNPA